MTDSPPPLTDGLVGSSYLRFLPRPPFPLSPDDGARPEPRGKESFDLFERFFFLGFEAPEVEGYEAAGDVFVGGTTGEDPPCGVAVTLCTEKDFLGAVSACCITASCVA